MVKLCYNKAMNKLLEQLESKRNRLDMSDYKFAAYLDISKQLWGQFKAGKIVYSRKIETAAWEKFHIAPENLQDSKPALKTTISVILSGIRRVLRISKP